jgi:chemosensory pili system protein ChpA (sensor histidine kinase/response regulator)
MMSEVSTQTLHVVARELNTELNESRAMLEAFGEQLEDATLLARCAEHLHNAQGALRLVEVYGAALLAEEMVQVARYLSATFDEKRNLAEGLDALMRAMVQLPTYIERVLNGGRDVALVLLPLLNDLRSVRGNPLLSEGTLLLLNLTSDQQPNPVPAAPGEPALGVAHWARKLRPRYQLGLLGWIRGERVEQNLEILARAAEKLEQVATTQPVFQLWWVVGSVLEALREDGLESSSSIKRLLGHADREMRRLYEQGEVRYAEQPPLELLNNLLYYIARVRSAGPRVSAVRASFRLGELLPVDDQIEAARESLSAPSVRLMKTVAAAIKEDLGRVKDAFDLYVRRGASRPEELAPQLDMLQKIGDTLGVLGLGGLRDRVQAEIAALNEAIADGAEADERVLLSEAATLIAVEDSLDEQLVSLIVPQATSSAPTDDDIEFRQVTEAVLRECIVNMARIKEAVALSVERPDDPQALDQVPQLTRGITSGLLMLGKTRAVEVTEAIRHALARYAEPGGRGLGQERMDRLADAIVSVEYYMETLQAGRADPWYMLDNAERCLSVLEEAAPVVDLPPELEAVDEGETVLLDTMPGMLPADSHERTQLIGTTPAATGPIRRPLPPVLAPSTDKADPEFVELFIEEAKDELVRIREFFPRWDERPEDFEALVSVRRSFHTLKGSGRMVGAERIGEFAWAIENLLNRVLNRTLERSPGIVALLREAVDAIAQLVEQLETGRDAVCDVASLIQRAHDLAGGPPLSAAPRPAPAPAAVAPRESAEPPVEPVAAPGPSGRPAMDPTLHDIYSKETAGHLQTIREYIATCERAAPPFAVTDAVYRSCHTLSGTAKTAGAQQGIKITEPLNHYIRKVYDNGMGLSVAGLGVLKDVVTAIEEVVAHIDADTGNFRSHERIITRVRELETELDAQLAELAAAAESTIEGGVPGFDTGTFEVFAPELARDDAREAEPGASAYADGAEGAAADDGPAKSIEVEPESTDEVAVEEEVAASEVRADDEFDLEDSARLVFDDAPESVDVESGAQAPAEDAPLDLEFDARAAGAHELAAADGRDDSGAEILFEDSGTFESPEPDEPESVRADSAPDRPELIVETAEWASSYEPPTLDEWLRQHEEAGQSSAARSAEPSRAPPPLEEEPVEGPARASLPPAGEPVSEAAPEEPAATEFALDDDFDADVAAIFTEEATELLESADGALARWTADRADRTHVYELKRALHTLKGGARMSGIRAMGDLSHELESFMIAIEAGSIPSGEPVFAALQASLDELHRMRDAVSHGRGVASARALIERIRGLARGEPEPEAGMSSDGKAQIAAEVPEIDERAADHRDMEREVSPAPFEESQAPAPEHEQIEPEATRPPAAMELQWPLSDLSRSEFEPESQAAAGETAPVAGATFDVAAMRPELPPDTVDADTVAALPPGRDVQTPERHDVARVDAELLDQLLNNAGEVSIFRSRLEQQVSSIEFNLAELGRTVTRLKEQLRKFEIETEAQILHRHQDESRNREGFDPLELDQYSMIQQLSRALAESVSDVASIEGLLENLTREAQNLLLQESRVVTELQNGLMRTRMVPFQRHVQRLARLVRQIAGETGRRAELAVEGASGELDRQVLERMLPPFEHILRNAVVHGIESPDERSSRGKPESGKICMSLRREGAEMVITIEDDGRGIDVEAVRVRARARGLIEPGRVLTDEEALQLVLEPGFSTASAVTQHAGRGVGMDVVVTEVKKLGGVLTTSSKLGIGTTFTIRLPFTLAISQALIVRIADEFYALPLPTIEGVARVPARLVARHLAEEEPTYEYGGQLYRFQHLGAFVGAGPSALPESDVSIAIILVRAGDNSTALVTDELIGSREIVVKSVGPQIAGIRGISGATILGDGRIVIILDLGSLVRSEWRTRPPEEMLRPVADKRTFALVVDDSITVRRVTQRLLERNGMRVMTAKDGVDALSILQEHVPDVILLDIEMPRMDGYELASHVRNDSRLSSIPIVMITSRVGEKHRARAIELGVDDYLGKPYQENQLLDAIEPLVEARRRQTTVRAGGER